MKFNNDNDYCYNIAKKKTKVKGDLRFLSGSQVIRLHLNLTEVLRQKGYAPVQCG